MIEIPFADLLEPIQSHRLALLKEELNKYRREGVGRYSINPVFVRMVSADLERVLVGRHNKLVFFKWAFDRDDITSSKDLRPDECFGLVIWANAHKDDGDLKSDPWKYSNIYLADLEILAIAFAGQKPLIQIAPPTKIKRSMDDAMRELGYDLK
jgi:hypothetical protein